MPSVAKKLVIVQNNDAPDAPTPAQAVRPEELRLLEAMLFAAGEPLDEATLSRRLPNDVDVKQALAALKAEYATRGVNLVRVGKKWMFRTADDLSWLLTKETVETRKLSRAAIETLAIIAYHQPVTRAEIEEIRGVVAAAGTLDVLLRDGLDPPARTAQGAGPADHLWHHGSSSSPISGWRRWAICPASRSSKAPACWRAICRRALRCRCRPTTRRCATTRTRSIRAISIWGWPRRPRAARDRINPSRPEAGRLRLAAWLMSAQANATELKANIAPAAT